MGQLGNPLYGQNKFDNSVDGKVGVVVNIKPSSDGTIASPTSTLTASDSGNIYIVDISANTAAFVLPSAPTAKGSVFTFILSIESDAEGTKDLLIASGSATEYLMGAGIDGGVIHDQQSDDDQIQIDTSAGAAGAGDRIKLLCDGNHWYVLDASCLTASALVSGTASR